MKPEESSYFCNQVKVITNFVKVNFFTLLSLTILDDSIKIFGANNFYLYIENLLTLLYVFKCENFFIVITQEPAQFQG